MRSYELTSEAAYMSGPDFRRIVPALSPSQLKRALKLRNEA
jgi:hypothetical protein